MKKFFAFALVLLLLLAVPVSAENYLVLDSSGLMPDHDVQKLEQVYEEFAQINGFTPVAITVDSFGGLSAEDFAAQMYDVQGYPYDCILLLVSLGEGEWYVLLNGECASRLSDEDASQVGESVLPLIRDGQYYAAFLAFPEEALKIYLENAPVETQASEYTEEDMEDPGLFAYFLTFGGWGFAIAAVVVIIMAVKMKSVGSKSAASDYIISGSAKLTGSRDIYLYSHTTRTAKPKESSSSGGSSGRSRGGAGGKI